MRLQEFNFKIECIAGKDNVVADVLSRIPWACVDSEGNTLSEPIEDYEFEPDEEVEFASLPAIEVEDPEVELIPELQPVTKEEIETEQQSDPNLIVVKQWMDSGILPDEESLAGFSKQMKIYYQNSPQIQIRDNLLGLSDSSDPTVFRVLIPFALIDRILMFGHSGPGCAHEGYENFPSEFHPFISGLS